MYLTMVPMGGNLEGVRAASLRYWGKEPRNLSLSEVALLLSVPQSPEARRPDRQPARRWRRFSGLVSGWWRQVFTPSSDLDELRHLPFEALAPVPNEAWHFSKWVVASAQQKQACRLALLRPAWIEDFSAAWCAKPSLFAKRLESLRKRVGHGDQWVRPARYLAYVGSLGLGTDAGYMDLTRATRSPGIDAKALHLRHGFR